jgi:hypothetical protein
VVEGAKKLTRPMRRVFYGQSNFSGHENLSRLRRPLTEGGAIAVSNNALPTSLAGIDRQ